MLDVRTWVENHVDLSKLKCNIEWGDERYLERLTLTRGDAIGEEEEKIQNDYAKALTRYKNGDITALEDLADWNSRYGNRGHLKYNLQLVEQALEGDKRALEEIEGLIETGQQSKQKLNPVQFGESTSREWLVENWIPRGAVTLLAGPGMVGKSQLALQLCHAAAQGGGRDVLGDGTWRTSRQCNSLYLTWEDDANEVNRRINRLGELSSVIHDSLKVFTLADVEGDNWLFGPVPGGSRHIATQGDVSPLFEKLSQEAENHDAKIIVIDTAASAFALDENIRSIVRRFLDRLTALAAGLNAAVILLSHPSKGHTVSGSTDWVNRPRSVVEMAWHGKVGDRQPKLTLAKHNWAGAQETIYLVPGEYPYKAGIEIPPEDKPPKFCLGYKDHECTVPMEGRTQRCPDCRKKHDSLRHQR